MFDDIRNGECNIEKVASTLYKKQLSFVLSIPIPIMIINRLHVCSWRSPGLHCSSIQLNTHPDNSAKLFMLTC